MSKMITYYVHNDGSQEPVKMVVPEEEVPDDIVDLFAGEVINQFSKSPRKSQEKIIKWCTNGRFKT